MYVTQISACATMYGNATSQWTGDFWLKSVLPRIAYLWMFLGFSHLEQKLDFEDQWVVLESLQTSLLWKVLAGAGSVAMANGVSNRWQMTCDTWHKTCDTWNMTFSSSFPFCLFLPFFALLPISANIDKVSDSCMRDFYLLILLYLSTELAASVRLRKNWYGVFLALKRYYYFLDWPSSSASPKMRRNYEKARS